MSADKVTEIFRPIVKLIIYLVALGIVTVMVDNLPGAATTFPNSSITVATAADAVVALVMVGIVLKFGREINPPLKKNLPGFPEISIMVSNIVFLVAVIIAYVSFEGLILPLLGNALWMYQLAFFAIALIPSMRTIETLFRSVGKWTDHVMKKLNEIWEHPQTT